MKNDEFDFLSPIDSAWALFEQTGEISYYALYKSLVEKGNKKPNNREKE